MAGINSFGFGGTNAHVIVREYCPPAPSSLETFGSRTLFPMSAATGRSLEMCIADTYARIRADRKANLKTLLYTSACRRSHAKYKYRKVFTASSLFDLEEQLKYEITAYKPVAFKPDPEVVFVFCGNGVAYRGMCKQLLEEEPIFRAKVQEVEECLTKYRSTRILQTIANGFDDDDFFKPDIMQPVLFATQVGLAYLLKHWGVRPAAVVGHSVGEVAAACCSGLLSLEDAVKVIHHRSVLQAKVIGGRMLVVGNVPVTRILDILPSYAGKLCLAAINSPLSCVLSGEQDAVESVYQRLEHSFKDENLFLHVLKVPAAYHSHMMDPILSQIRECIGFLQRRDTECELFSSVTGKACGLEDFVTGDYWAKNIRNPVAFEQVVKAISSSKRNLIYVEIGPKKVLQKNIMETLGEDTVVLPVIQPNNELESVFNTVSRLFEMGVNVDWDQFYKGFESPPASYPVYHFDCLKNDVYFEEIRQGNEIMASSSHPLVCPSKGNGTTYKCSLSSETNPYFWEHKNNGTAIAPGALFVELALASAKKAVVPKKPVSHLKLTINFQNLLILSKNSHDLRIQLEMGQSKAPFRIQSSAAVHASGTVFYGSQPSMVEHQNIKLDAIFKRCSSVIARELVYATLNQAGFEYGPTFQQLGDVQYGEEFKEAVGIVKIPKELVHQLYEFCLHPVVLDYFLQMTAVLILSADTSRRGFPSGIGSLVVTAPLCRVVVMYMKVTQEMPEYFEVCGCLTDEQGHTLVELKDVRLTFLEKELNTTDLFFHNERITAHPGTRICSKPRVVVLEDTLGIAIALKPYFDPSSVFLLPTKVTSQVSDLLLQADRSGIEKTVLIWSSNLNHLGTQSVLDHLVDICDFYRQVVLTLRNCQHLHTLLVVTYRSSESVVDHISPGFVLSGMTRACAAESSEVSFQLIDLATVSREDIEMLVDVICNFGPHEYPEITICKGQIQSTVIARTPMITKIATTSLWPECLTLQTADPYAMTGLSAIPSCNFPELTKATDVEVEVCKICVHSEDYFPVSVSSLKYARTLYWNRQKSQSHLLVALDFSGTVTAVGKDVHNFKVGDHIVACYPTLATSKVILPEMACYKTSRLWVLRDVPCISYFILSWEILCKTLSKPKQMKTMAIFSSVPDSGLVTVFSFTATKSGWNVVTQSDFTGLQKHFSQCFVCVFLPPYEQTWIVSLASDGCERQIILVGRNQSALCPSSILRDDSGNLSFHFLTMEDILQKCNLKARRGQVDRWLKLMQTEGPLALRSWTFHATADETDTAKSYFSARTLPLIVLENIGSVANASHICLQPKARQLFSKKGVYIVSGGLSGLGFETVKFISHWGAKHITTLSRRFPSQETQDQIHALKRRYGVIILTLQCDVSLSDQVLKALTSIGRRFPSCPIKGVFHSAAVLHDGLLQTLDKSAFKEVLRPKVSGALNLHYATLNSKLDYFVCYSSISSFIGNASQANYAAANSFLDALCQYRRNLGLAGQSINWGPLKLGLLLNKGDFQKFLEVKGMLTMEVPEIHKALKHCLLENKVQQAVCKFNFRNLSNNVLSQNASLKARLSTLVQQELESNVISQPRKNLRNSGEECVKGIIGAICNVDPEEIGGETVLAQVGMDSMLAMTLQNQLFQETGISVPLVKLLDPNTTIHSLMILLQENKDEEPVM